MREGSWKEHSFNQLQVLVQASKMYSEFLLCRCNKIDHYRYKKYVSFWKLVIALAVHAKIKG